jgi:hypothetical protein
MTTTNPKSGVSQSEPVLSTGADALMSADQERVLRELAKDALEPEAFSRVLTQSEAARRIEVLTAKLKLMSHPPHTA